MAEAKEDSASDELHFGRAQQDGMPFRGPSTLLKEDEYQTNTEQVNDAFAELFDLSNKEHKQKYVEILDRAANHWYLVLKDEHHFVTKPDGLYTVIVDCVWLQPYRQLSTRI